MTTRPKAWLLAAVILIGAAGLLVLMAPWRTGDAPDRPPEEPERKFLEGEVVDRAMGEALDRLRVCLGKHPKRPACRQAPVVRLKLRARRGRGRYTSLVLDEGWLAPELLDCWEHSLQQEGFDPAGQEGIMEIRYPIGCDPQGAIHIRPPAPGVKKEGEPPPMPGTIPAGEQSLPDPAGQ